MGIFLASYYSSANAFGPYRTTLITNIKGINEVNKTIAQFNSNQTIDVNYAKEQLPNIINDLSTFKANLANSKPSSKYKKDTDNLMSGLDKNKLLYMQVLGILNNPSGVDVETSMKNLKTYRDDCMNFYSLIDINNNKITLPQTSLTFIDNVLNYSLSAFKIKKETDVKLQQNKEFISKVDGLSNDLLDAKTNYYSYVLKVRKKEMSYDALLSLVDKNFTKLSIVQKNSKNLSIPATGIPTYEALRALLDVYESYLSDFKFCLTSEKVQSLSAAVDSTAIDALYTSSNASFDKVQNDYKYFTKVYTELKNK